MGDLAYHGAKKEEEKSKALMKRFTKITVETVTHSVETGSSEKEKKLTC